MIKKSSATLSQDGKSKLAIESFLGESWVKSTVDYIIQLKPEWNLAINCLRVLESELATDYAYSIYKNSIDNDDRRIAALIVKDIAHPKSIAWVEEFLGDQNTADFGIGILDQLLWSEKIEFNEMTDSLLNKAEQMWDGSLSSNVSFIRDYLSKRSCS